MPHPALAAIVIAAMLHLSRPDYLRDLFGRSRWEFVLAAIVIAGEPAALRHHSVDTHWAGDILPPQFRRNAIRQSAFNRERDESTRIEQPATFLARNGGDCLLVDGVVHGLERQSGENSGLRRRIKMGFTPSGWLSLVQGRLLTVF